MRGETGRASPGASVGVAAWSAVAGGGRAWPLKVPGGGPWGLTVVCLTVGDPQASPVAALGSGGPGAPLVVAGGREVDGGGEERRSKARQSGYCFFGPLVGVRRCSSTVWWSQVGVATVVSRGTDGESVGGRPWCGVAGGGGSRSSSRSGCCLLRGL